MPNWARRNRNKPFAVCRCRGHPLVAPVWVFLHQPGCLRAGWILPLPQACNALLRVPGTDLQRRERLFVIAPEDSSHSWSAISTFPRNFPYFPAPAAAFGVCQSGDPPGSLLKRWGSGRVCHAGTWPLSFHGLQGLGPGSSRFDPASP